MRGSDRLGLAVIAAMVLGLFALQPVTADRRLFADGLLIIAVVGGAGIVARRLMPAERGARLVQALVGLAGFALLMGSEGLANPFAVRDVLVEATRWTVESSAPMGPNLAVRAVTVAALGLLTYLADQLAIGMRSPAWVLLPLGVLYLIPALALPGLMSFGPVFWLGTGFLLVLLADAVNRSRLLRFGTDGGPRGGLGAGGVAALVGALIVAGLAGVLTPGLDPSRGAPFSGQGPVQMGDPTLDLRRNLQQPVDRVVITYTTSRDAGSYLRMTSLPAFDATGFHLNAIDLFTGTLPAPQGAPAGLPRYTVDVTVGDFNAEWLPLPYAPAAFDASGDWRHDPLSLSVLASGARQKSATNRISYSATVVDVTPTADDVLAALAGTPTDANVTSALPADLPPQIVELAREVTADADTAGAKAIAIQDWLRSSAFTYSTEPAPGSGYTALTSFLFEDRRGYCEQFATSMAVLARAVGIPSRVAVGFLPGAQRGDGYEVSIRDMHAWPELYLAGLGWVAFEPTQGVATPPGYTNADNAEPTPSPSPSATPSASTPSEEPSAEASTPAEAEGEEPGPLDLSWLGWVGGGLAAAALLAAPALLRRARRRRRLTLVEPDEAVPAAWAELRDTVWDAGGEWPRGSARQIGAEVADGLDDDSAAAVHRVAVLVERARYADHIGATGQLPADVTRAREALSGGKGSAWWRRLLPRSLWRGLWWRG